MLTFQFSGLTAVIAVLQMPHIDPVFIFERRLILSQKWALYHKFIKIGVLYHFIKKKKNTALRREVTHSVKIRGCSSNINFKHSLFTNSWRELICDVVYFSEIYITMCPHRLEITEPWLHAVSSSIIVSTTVNQKVFISFWESGQYSLNRTTARTTVHNRRIYRRSYILWTRQNYEVPQQYLVIILLNCFSFNIDEPSTLYISV